MSAWTAVSRWWGQRLKQGKGCRGHYELPPNAPSVNGVESQISTLRTNVQKFPSLLASTLVHFPFTTVTSTSGHINVTQTAARKEERERASRLVM